MSVLWTNPRMKYCPLYPERCHFANESQAEIDTHVLNVHKDDVLRAQGKLEGGVVTEDDKRLAVLQSLPIESFQCPFCLSVFQNSTVTRFFLDDGKLSKMALCKKDAGGCGKRMLVDSMRKTKLGPRDFGRYVGSYPRFWGNVDHDRWMKLLKTMYKPVAALKWDDVNQPMSQFWLGYGDVRPEFAEKQRIARATKEYEADRDAAEREDQEDETGR